MSPRVSVIITTFKRPQFLREAMASVLAQDFKDFELIIINDDPNGSETDKIVSSFRDWRIVYIKNKENIGSTKSLNVGLRAARGEYVAVLDDDDSWLSPAKLKEQVGFLDSRPDYVCLGSRFVVVDADSGIEITRSKISGEDPFLRSRFFLANPFAHSTMLFRRRAALKAGGYDESLPRGKDYDLWLKLAALGKAAVLPDYFVKYREVSGSPDILRRRLEDARWTLKVMQRHWRNFPGSTLPLFRQCVRYFIFRLLQLAPILYSAYRAVKKL